MTFSLRRIALRTLQRSEACARYFVAIVTMAGLAACSSDNGPLSANGYIRIVNSTFQADPTGQFFTPIAIDVLIDSSGSGPGATNIEANGIANGPTGPNGHEAKFFSVAPGIHSFVARKSGLTPAGPSFYTTSPSTSVNCTPQEYLPRQQLTGATFYTLIVAGINPAPIDSSGTMINVLAPAGIPTSTGCYIYPAFPITSIAPTNVEQPYTPPTTTESGSPVLQTSLHFWNAAPFLDPTGIGAGITMYLTDGTPSTGPTASTLASYAGNGYADYLTPSPYAYFTPKPYWLTLMANGQIIYQTKINYASGEVHTMIVQNVLPLGETSFPAASGDDPTTYTKVTDILDNKY